MQHRAMLPAVLHWRVFNECRELLADAIPQCVSLFVFTVTPLDAVLLAEHVHRFRQTVYAKHRHKPIGVNQPLFYQEAILKKARLRIQEIAARIDDGDLLLTVVRERAGKEVFGRSAVFGNGLKVKAYKGAATACKRQRVVTTHHAIATFCENFIIHRTIGNMRFTAFTYVFRHLKQQIVRGDIWIVDKGQIRRNLLQFCVSAQNGACDGRICRADIGVHKGIRQGSVEIAPETFYSAIDLFLC